MADAEAEAAPRPEMPRVVAALRARLWQLQAELREQEVSEPSSRSYCRGFCQTLLQYAGSRGASEHILPFLEVYRISIQSFANARPYLTTECEDVLLVLGRLVLSCFELLLSVSESELPHEVWLGFHQSIQDSHDALLEFGNNNLQILVDITREGIWKHPVLLKILSQQPVEAEEANKLITQEGPSFLQMRIKHLMKSNCIPQARCLSKLCAESSEIANVSSFRQAYITCVCSMLPNEDCIKEIAKVDCKEVLDIICNLEAEGQENTAFVLCTTYLTHQLQTANVYCSWELTLFWSKLQRRIDPSLDSFLERCRQFGIIAKTLQHLFFLIRVIQSEAEEAGLAVSVLLCVRALQIRSNGSDEMKTSVCKTIACLLPEDLEVRRACQLTEFLLEPTLSGFNVLEELYMQPDQKFDEENALVPNSLRCELLLALKAYWPFDPEFWDWKTLKRHCLKLLGKAASDSEDDASCNMSVNETDMLETFFSDYEEAKEHKYYDGKDTMNHPKEKVRVKKPIGSSERYQRWLQYKFFCVLCKRECIEARILHHSKMHMEDGVYTCPVCTKKFKRKELFVPHVMEHVKMPPSRTHRPKKKLILKKERSPQKITASSSPPPACQEKSHQLPESFDNDAHEYVTFSQLENCQLQDRDIYPCPGTDCSRVFKQFKYLSVHLKAEHQNNDENAKHYLDMKNRREKCAYCRRHFMTSFHLREHERVHCGPQPYMCVSMDCYARFGSVNELLNHKQTHDDLRYKCELNGCNIVFSDLGQLYHHEAQHFRDASYTCNFFGCKKFYYSKSEFQNHLAVHNIEVSNGEVKRVKLEGSVSKDKCSYLPESQLLEQSENPSLNDNLDPSGSQEIPQIKEEALSDSEDLDSESNCSLHSGEHRSDAAVNQGQVSPLLLEAAHHQSVPGYLVSQEGVFHPADVKQQCSNVAVCLDGKRISCGFEGCCSTHKNTRSMQRHLRRVHPYHFKGKRNMEMKTKDFLNLLSEAQDGKSPTDINTQLGHSSDTNADSPESVYYGVDAKGSNGLKEETCPSSPETSFYDSSKDSSIEDNMLELMLGLKHLSLKNSTIQNSSRHKAFLGSLQPYSSRDGKCPESGDETTSKFQLQEQQDNLPSQYLTQLAAKPFFCECQGCTCEFVTREALLMHYVRKHNYSKEMVLQLNMFQHRYSPFKCHICQRSFTRKTHLRIHYKNKHQIGSERAAHKVCSNDKFDHVGLCTDDLHKGSTVPAPVRAPSVEFNERSSPSEQPCRTKKEDCSSETDLESNEETDSNVRRKTSNIASLDGHREELEARQGRGSKRTVAKGNLCYILHKYHKPFHCIHKSCNSAFTNQKGLIRHYRTVHQYNKEQLCLERDKARKKRELVKCKKIFACKHKDCGMRFLCSKALAKHCSDFHNEHLEDQKLLSEAESARFACNQPHCPAVFCTFNKLKRHLIEDHASEEKLNKDFEIHCDLNGCDRIFTNYSHYSQHVYFRHSEYYDSLFRNQEEEQDKAKNEQGYLKDGFGVSKQNGKPLKAKRTSRSREKHLLNFKTKEEALQMCKEKSNQTQYPCMVQGCLSVVKLESSIVRHYKRTHQMTNMYIEQQLQRLVVCVKCGVMTEKQLCSNTASSSDNKGVDVPPEDKSANPEPVQESDQPLVPNTDCEPQDVSNEDQKRLPSSDVSFDASAFTYSGTLKCNHSSENASFEEQTIRETVTCKAQELSEEGEKETSSYLPGLQLELPRKTDPEGSHHSAVSQATKRNVLCATKDKFHKPPVSKPFDLKTFKPMGFESSFLKFIQESEGKDDDDDDDLVEEAEWDSTEQLPVGKTLGKEGDNQGEAAVNSFVDDKNAILAPNTHEQLTEIQPLLSESSSAPSLENLRAILDKALTDCGDLALKQLHYLRPVVVLERSKFSTPLIDLFPTKKADELCVGST